MKWIIAIVVMVSALLLIWMHHAMYGRDIVYAGEVVFIGILAVSNYIHLRTPKGGGNPYVKW